MSLRDRGRQLRWRTYTKGNRATCSRHVWAWSTVVVSEPGANDYGDTFADVYDSWYENISDVGALIEMMKSLSHGSLKNRRILECGVGTGRVGLPLAAEGAEVTGIDNSPAMLQRLQENDTDRKITSILGDMTRDLPSAEFDAVVVAFNTLFNLLSEQSQRDFFLQAAQRLAPSGYLLIEGNNFREIEATTSRSESTRPDGTSVISTSYINPETQIASGTFDDGVTLRNWTIRYLTAAQMDSMAHDAGLVLMQRTEDATGATFTDHSERHVSVYRRPILELP